MKVKSTLIALAVRTQFHPFDWIYRQIYHLAIRVSVSYVRRFEGVCSIYLSGSLARGHGIWGLSDIDFKIFIRGRRNAILLGEIRDRFTRLRRVFPMLGPADEKGVYFVDDFARDYTHYPLIRLLFDERFYRHRLLWGKPIIGTLGIQSPAGSEAYPPFLWKFRDWLEKSICLTGGGGLSPTQERYLLYKAAGDLSAIHLILRAPAWPGKARENALQEVREYLAEPERGVIDRLLAERHTSFRKGVTDPEETFALIRHLIALSLEQMCMEHPVPGPRVPREISDDAGPVPEELESVARHIRSGCPADTRLLMVPWRRLPLSPLDCVFFARPALLVLAPRPLRLAEIHRLRDASRQRLAGHGPLMIGDGSPYFFSAYSDLLDHWMSPAGGDDLFHRETVSRSDGPDDSLRARVEARMAAYLEQMSDLVRSPEISRMNRDLYLRLIFTAVQTLAAHRDVASGVIRILDTASAAVAWLRGNTPLSRRFLDRLEGEFAALTSGRRPFDEAFFHKTRAFLTVLVDLACRGASCEELASLNAVPDAQGLRISVVVVTRSRCMQLMRCLNSMLALERPPEELIVVDNASRDETRQAVAGFQAPFPVRYVFEAEVGVNAARNAGVAAASGDVISFTDDDAVVHAKWLSAVESAFLRDSRIGVVGGRIENLRCGRTDLAYRYGEIVARI